MPRRPKSFTAEEDIEQIFQDKDRDNSDIDVGDFETEDDDFIIRSIDWLFCVSTEDNLIQPWGRW